MDSTITGNVVAWVICADPLPGYHIVHNITAPSSADVQTAEARCPSGRRALASGAEILAPTTPHGVGLQVGRASGAGDLTRAQAHEQPQGYPYAWQLVASAICTDTPAGYQVRYSEPEERASEVTKRAVADCPEHTVLIGAGAAVSNVAPGNVALYSIRPNYLILPYSGDLASWVSAEAAETTPDTAALGLHRRASHLRREVGRSGRNVTSHQQSLPPHG